jgi:two-component system, cell cycle sensor histidine kinase and response regulator CckA
VSVLISTKPSIAAPTLLLREEANQALRDQRFRLLVQGVRDYAIFMLDPAGRIICWNTGAEAIFGYHEDEILGGHYALLFTREDAHDGKPDRELEQALTGRFENEGWRLRKDGSSFRVHLMTAAVLQNGQLLGYSQIARDVTEHERMERQLRHSHRMEAVGTLAAGVAHDFNNLLSVIIGYSEILLALPGVADAIREPADHIKKAGERAATLTRQLLAFSRKQLLVPKVLDLNAFLVDLSPLLRRLGGEGVQVITDLSGDVSNVEADAGQLEQMLLNLTANARDAMPGGGQLTVRTTNVGSASACLSVPREVTPGHYVLLILSDRHRNGRPDDGPDIRAVLHDQGAG